MLESNWCSTYTINKFINIYYLNIASCFILKKNLISGKSHVFFMLKTKHARHCIANVTRL